MANRAPSIRRLGERVLFRVCRTLLVGASRLYFPGRVIGASNLPAAGGYILAPVHRSGVDWLLVARVSRRRLRYLTKDEVWRFRRLGRLIEILGAFPVHRGGADREAFGTALDALANQEPLVWFPEGTRRSGPEVAEVKEGAAYLALRAGVPLVPIGLGGSELAMRRGARLPRPTRITIVIGAPIGPRSGEHGTDPRGAASRRGARNRVPRSEIRALSEQLRLAIQQQFDEAEHRRGAAGRALDGAGRSVSP
jgi:1-acyl-sn-glycerol-3-phosphate acyltransferase